MGGKTAKAGAVKAWGWVTLSGRLLARAVPKREWATDAREEMERVVRVEIRILPLRPKPLPRGSRKGAGK